MKRFFLVLCSLLVVCLLTCCSKEREFHEVRQGDGEIWLYLAVGYYQNDSLGVSIIFPESWVENIILVESDTGVAVHFRKAFEQDPILGGAGATLFIFQAVDKKNDYIIRDLADNPMVSLFAENESANYYITKLCGGIKVYFADIWKENSELLEEMALVIDTDMHDMIRFLQ